MHKHNQQQPPNTVQISCGSQNDTHTHSPTDTQQPGMNTMDGSTKVVDVSKRTVKDGNQKVGRYTGQCRITTNKSTERRLYIPIGRGRMVYANKSVYDGEWKDGLWHGDGTLSTGSGGEAYDGEWIKGKRDGLGHQSDSNGNKYIGEWKDGYRDGVGSFTHHSGWTVEGQWEKDRYIKYSSVSGVTNANYESAFDWAQQQEVAAIVAPLVEAIGGLGVDMSLLLRDARSKGLAAGARFFLDKLRQTALHMACKKGKMNEVKRLLKDGAEVDEEDKDGFTALDVAILHSHLGVARVLCKKIDIDPFGIANHDPSLYWAAHAGRVNVVKELIEKRADIEVKDDHGWTPLHCASRNGHLDVVKCLVANKADVNAKDHDGDTPLHWASRNGHLNVVQFLFEHKADINAKTNYGSTPLHLASNGHYLDVVQFLVEHKADINAKDKDGWAPLHWASGRGHLGVVRHLVKKKADIHAKDEGGMTPLHWASQNGRLIVVKFLVDNKADINAKDNNGDTPLHYASWKGQLYIVKFLVNNDVDINVKQKDGWTPLHRASEKGHLDVAWYLLSRGWAKFEVRVAFVVVLLAVLLLRFQ